MSRSGQHQFALPTLLIAISLSLMLVAGVGAQTGFELPPELSGLSSQASDPAENLSINAIFRATPDGTQGLLSVTATLGGNWHIYSVTQKDGGPMRTKIVLAPSEQYRLTGPFMPGTPPKSRRLEFYDVAVEEHAGKVTWTAPIRLQPGVMPEQLVIEGKLDGQICDDSVGCVPLMTLDTSFAARVDGIVREMPTITPSRWAGPQPDASPAESIRRIPPVDAVAKAPIASPIPRDLGFAQPPPEGFRAGNIHVTVNGRIEPAGASPGDTVKLVISAHPDDGWHVYAYAEQNPKQISQPLLIAVVEPRWHVGKVQASEAPTVKQTGLKIDPTHRYHESSVEFSIPITIPEDATAGSHKIQGMLGYQTCSDSQCDMPTGAYFSGTIKLDGSGEGVVPLKFAQGDYRSVDQYLADASLAFDVGKIQVDESVSRRSTLNVLLLALAGGFLLNFMPCVLPVIGLKVMSFVHQAGEHRGRVFALNVWYAIGMLTVFWVLAGLATMFGLGWGEQYNNNAFTITLLCVVFVMGLSFLGVWEIPIPGFVGSGKATEIAQQEGLAGAFSKGVLTTILATPCSGPGVAAAITWSTNKPASLVFLVFTFMGLGMALPYLIIGAFPRLVRFIPKPGPWMDTFKQAMGFVLMGTVVYMFTMLNSDLFIPTLALIFALWAACWWIGQTPITADWLTKLRAWAAAAALASLVFWGAFVYKPNREHDLPWQEFTLAALEGHVRANRTVMIDFTADWCPTCKVLERTVLNTKPVRQMVDKNDVVTLVADWSDSDPEIGELLTALGSKQLPVIAIFPADDPYRPKKLSGGYTRSALLQRLAAAGPSTAPRVANNR